MKWEHSCILHVLSSSLWMLKKKKKGSLAGFPVEIGPLVLVYL